MTAPTLGTAAPAKPLSGIRIVDFTRVLAGPYCAMLLADLGAEVVKVEIPGTGDPLRIQGPPFHAGVGVTFLATNRNKRSLTLDMQTPQGKEIAYQLCINADVVLENFRPDVMTRLGLGYERLSTQRPELIYASISGLGADGPDHLQGAFDLTIQALGGYMSITGERDGAPVKLGTSAFDIVAGMNCHAAVLAALLQRKETGRGQKIETSLLEGQVAFLANAAVEYQLTSKVPGRWGSEHPQLVPYKAFKASDGWLVLAAGYQNQFAAFLRVLGREDLLADPRYATEADRVVNRESLYATLDAEVARHSVAALLQPLEAAKVPCAPVNNLEQVFSHRQVRHRKMIQEVEHPGYGKLPQVGPSTKFSAFDVASGWTAPPLLGEHTDKVLNEWLGLEEAEIASLRDTRVI